MSNQQLFFAVAVPLVVALSNTGLLLWLLSEVRDLRKEMSTLAQRIAVLERPLLK